jgi:energy-coupling factor transporter transmembrane protein EcfT
MANTRENTDRVKTNRVKTLEFFLLLILLLIFLFLLIRSPFLLYFAIGAAGTGLFLNKISFRIYLGWKKFCQVIASIITWLVLSFIFFLVLFPVSIIYRLIKKDPLKLRPGQYTSLFENRSKLFTSADLDNMW